MRLNMAKRSYSRDDEVALLSRADDVELLNDKAAAKLLDISADTLPVWRSTKRYPLPYTRIGRNIRYKKADVLAFIESRMVAR
jgi:predicted DNA-binding transcriptional regulator AlpA